MLHKLLQSRDKKRVVAISAEIVSPFPKPFWPPPWTAFLPGPLSLQNCQYTQQLTGYQWYPNRSWYPIKKKPCDLWKIKLICSVYKILISIHSNKAVLAPAKQKCPFPPQSLLTSWTVGGLSMLGQKSAFQTEIIPLSHNEPSHISRGDSMYCTSGKYRNLNI